MINTIATTRHRLYKVLPSGSGSPPLSGSGEELSEGKKEVVVVSDVVVEFVQVVVVVVVVVAVVVLVVVAVVAGRTITWKVFCSKNE